MASWRSGSGAGSLVAEASVEDAGCWAERWGERGEGGEGVGAGRMGREICHVGFEVVCFTTFEVLESGLPVCVASRFGSLSLLPRRGAIVAQSRRSVIVVWGEDC